jgi:N-acetylneuraminic acid mutarotase
MLPQDVRDDLNATITHERLAADVRADLNRTITHSHLSSQLKADLNRTITKQMLGQDVLSDLNRTVLLSDLSTEVSQSMNRPITRDMLPQDVRDDLNATITRERLSADIRADLNRTITHSHLSAELKADLNRTITKQMLGQDVLSDLNRTVTQQDLSPQVRADINATIGMNRLSTEVTEKLNQEKTTNNYNAPSVGSLLALPYGSSAPAGYSLYQRGEPKELVWEEKAPVSLARNAYDGVEVLDGKIYFVGGWGGNREKLLERYDSVNDSWETLAPMDQAREAITASLNGKIYAIGGRGSSGSPLSSIEIYDPETDSWSDGVSLPSAVEFGEAIAISQKIFLIGGKNTSGQNLNQVICFDPTSNQWIAKANMPTARRGHKLVWFENRIWALGGYTSTSSNRVESYDPDTDSWQTEASLRTARESLTAWVANGRIYVGGGNNGSQISSIEVYDHNTNSWENAGNFTENKANAGSVVLNDKVYVIAGSDGSYTNKVFAADLNASMAGVYDLYRKDGDAPVGTPVVQSEYADGSVTTAKLDGTILKYLKPEITAQPQASPIYAGGEGIVSFSAEGKYLTYKWKKDGVDLAGETNATLNISGANANLHEGNYSVVVSNDFGSVESGEVEVKVSDSLLSGLIGWWKFDETSGTVAYDTSGYELNGITSGTPTWATGKIGGALGFGSNDFVDCGNDDSLNLSGEFTISLWIKVNSGAPNGAILKKSDGYHIMWDVDYESLAGGGIQSVIASSDWNEWGHGSNPITANTWTHILYLLQDSNEIFFKDGEFLKETEIQRDVPSVVHPLTIGGNGFQGFIDDVRIYDRALSAEEVQALYNLGQ